MYEKVIAVENGEPMYAISSGSGLHFEKMK